MSGFIDEYFQKTAFSKAQIAQFIASAERDLKIAEDSAVPEVVFKFSYDSLIKTGLTLIAKKGYRVRSKPGHHIKLIEKIAEILQDGDVAVWANKMRQDRNIDLYSGGTEIGEKESAEYLLRVKGIALKAAKNV